MIASEIMTKGVITINRNATVKEALEKMINRRITSLIVEKEDEDEVYGIVTRKDIINKVVAYEKDPEDVKVSEIMSEPLMTISPGMGVHNIARLMSKTNIRRFPVMSEDKIVGMVSNSDILKAIGLGD